MSNVILMGVLSNILIAAVLALLTLAVARLWRNPHVTHALWLLVLIKLVTPPIVEIPAPQLLRVVQSESPSDLSLSTTRSRPVERTRSTHGQPQPFKVLDAGTGVTVPVAKPFKLSWTGFLLSGWLTGTIVFIVVAFRRNAQFSRLIAKSHPATTDLVNDANRIAAKMGLTTSPQVRTTTARVSPLVTGAWRERVILLPQNMLVELSRDQTRTVLAHELAHIRRRDHQIQLLKFSILALHWWNPLAWFASRQLEQSQEECCDAWVVWALPDQRRVYGQTLLQTVEFLTEPRRLPVVTETFMSQCNLERRIEMVLKQTIPQRVSRHTIGVAFVIGLVFLPTAFTSAVATEPVVQASQQSTHADQQGTETVDTTNQTNMPALTNADLPYVVEFEQGATRFLDGDEIVIQEVRGTAKTFEPGHIFRIKGTYKLASHDQATVAAYTTAKNASDGESRSLKVQHKSVDRGKGEFALFLPMSYQGWPHVSFYPHDGGQGFGGNYFGTGEYVLKKWWKDGGKKKPVAAGQAITLDKVLWTDAPELRQRLGEKIFNSLKLGLVARVRGYDGDWEALKQHQSASGSVFRLEAEGSPTLIALMRNGGITFGKREAWVLLNVEGQPNAKVDYTIRVPDSNWVVESPVPAR